MNKKIIQIEVNDYSGTTDIDELEKEVKVCRFDLIKCRTNIKNSEDFNNALKIMANMVELTNQIEKIGGI